MSAPAGASSARRAAFRAYRDLDELERDRARMEAKGWQLRGWRARDRTHDWQGPDEASGMASVAHVGAPTFGLYEFVRLLAWAVMAVVTLPVVLIRGRKRIDAMYVRPDGR